MKKNIFSLLCVLLLLCACRGSGTSSPLQGEGDTIPMRYAKNITMVRYGDHVVEVKLTNPWGEGLLGTYILTSDPDAIPPYEGGVPVINTPLKNALVFTAVHCGLI